MKVLDHVLEGFVWVSWWFLLRRDVELLDGRLQGLDEIRLSALSLQSRRRSSSRLDHPEGTSAVAVLTEGAGEVFEVSADLAAIAMRQGGGDLSKSLLGGDSLQEDLVLLRFPLVSHSGLVVLAARLPDRHREVLEGTGVVQQRWWPRDHRWRHGR